MDPVVWSFTHKPNTPRREVIQHCLMIEPTETESLATLDHFAAAMLEIADEIESDPEVVRNAPHTTPVKRLDEVSASRRPNVRWKNPE